MVDVIELEPQQSVKKVQQAVKKSRSVNVRWSVSSNSKWNNSVKSILMDFTAHCAL